MASLNGGVIGVDNQPTSTTTDETITTFTSSGTLTLQAGTVTVDYLVVAGGGAGGRCGPAPGMVGPAGSPNTGGGGGA